MCIVTLQLDDGWAWVLVLNEKHRIKILRGSVNRRFDSQQEAINNARHVLSKG